jgi:hypothetical protein
MVPGEGHGPWAVLSAAASVTLTRVVPISLATTALRGALMFAEAPLLALVGGPRAAMRRAERSGAAGWGERMGQAGAGQHAWGA